MHEPRPLIPVTIEGLEALAQELLTSTGGKPPVHAGKGVVLAPSYIKDPENYIGVPQIGAIISKRERHKNLKWEPTLKAIHEEGGSLGGKLSMPDIPDFMTHFFNVKEAALGRGTLYDGRGKPLKKDEAVSQWNYFSSTDRSPFNGQMCWTWLNAKFVKGKGALKLNLQTDYHFDASGNLVFSQTPLEACLEEDALVDLDKPFNKQYLATSAQKSANINYAQGHNLYFWYPRKNAVARFAASSGGAGLGCNGSPSLADPALGVFVCAEGAPPEK